MIYDSFNNENGLTGRPSSQTEVWKEHRGVPWCCQLKHVWTEQAKLLAEHSLTARQEAEGAKSGMKIKWIHTKAVQRHCRANFRPDSAPRLCLWPTPEPKPMHRHRAGLDLGVPLGSAAWKCVLGCMWGCTWECRKGFCSKPSPKHHVTSHQHQSAHCQPTGPAPLLILLTPYHFQKPENLLKIFISHFFCCCLFSNRLLCRLTAKF